MYDALLSSAGVVPSDSQQMCELFEQELHLRGLESAQRATLKIPGIKTCVLPVTTTSTPTANRILLAGSQLSGILVQFGAVGDAVA